MVVLIQDSQGISTATVDNIKTVVRRLLPGLSSEVIDYNFALATYATSRQMSCFGNAADTVSYMDREYQHGQRGTQNLLKDALGEMILKQFNKRRNDRKGKDTAKVSFNCDYFPFLSKLCDQIRPQLYDCKYRNKLRFSQLLMS